MKHIIYVMILFLLIPFAVAGTPFSDYEEDGAWGSGYTPQYYRISTTASVQYPLIYDLDNDTTNEIIIIDSNNVEIYQGSTLTAIDGFQAEDPIHHAVIHDIDRDGTSEVLTVGGDKYSIFDFNGTDITLRLNLTIPNIQSSELEIGCYLAECAIINGRFTSGAPSSETLYAVRVTNTTISSSIAVEVATNNGDWILPHIRYVEVIYDEHDGRAEYVVTAFETAENNLHVWSLYSNTTHILEDDHYEIYEPDADIFAPPMSHNIDVSSSGYETMIAYQTGTDDFTFRMLDETLTSVDTYAIAVFDEGQLVSNIIRMRAFGDYLTDEFCALGYDGTGDEINLVCTNPIADDTDGLDVDTPYDLTAPVISGNTPNFRRANTMILPVQTSATTSGGVNLHEVLTPYGIYELDYDFWTGDDLNPVFEFPYATLSDGSFAYDDIEGVGESDIIYMLNRSVYYADDGFSNTQADIISHGTDTGNPVCPDEIITISVAVEDIDLDSVTCWINETFINGTVIDTLSNDSVVGAGTATFFYHADTQGVRFLEIYCTDYEHTHPDHETRQVVISNSTGCHDAGEGGSTTYIEEEEEEEAQETAIETANDELQESVEDIPIIGDLLASSNILLILYLVFCFIIAGGVMYKFSNVYLGIGSFIVMLIIGTILTIVPAYYILLLAIFATIITIIVFISTRSSGG